MVARAAIAVNLDGPPGEESGEEQGRFDLCRWRQEDKVARLDFGSPAEREGKAPVGRLDSRAEGAQLRRDRLHWAPAQGCVPVEARANVSAGAGSQEHPCRRTRVHAVENAGWSVKSAASDDDVLTLTRDRHAQRFQRLPSRAHVAARVEMCYVQRLGASGSGNERPVRNRLVTRDGNAAAQPARMKGHDALGHRYGVGDKESIIIS